MGQTSLGADDIMLPILKFLKDGYERNYLEIIDHLTVHFGLSMKRYTGAWHSLHETAVLAKTRMSQAGLLRKKFRIFHISDLGLEVLKQQPEKIDHTFLRKFKTKIDPNIPTHTISAKDRRYYKIDRLNDLISSARDIIMSQQKGAYMSDIRTILGISQEEMSGVAERVIRIDSISKSEIQYDGMLLDVLFVYSDSTQKADRVKEAPPEQRLDAITRQMVGRYATDRRRINKHLRQRLTVEFVESRSMKKVFQNNPDIAREKIMLHVRTSLRLPERLRQLEQEGAIHSDPDWSLHIALFAVNHYGWDGEQDGEDRVIRLAQQLAKQVRRSRDTKHETDSKDPLVAHSGSTPTATAIWIATAKLHIQYGENRSFSNGQIAEKTRNLGLLNVSDATIAMHVSSHCVANIPPTPSKHRKLYRVSHGNYRLYRIGDYYNPERKHGEEAPDIAGIPDEHRHVLDWYRKTNPT